jgi:3-hydroxyisobutyrate dehydrogenase-like beta-hydroxyacid dehydrogenase
MQQFEKAEWLSLKEHPELNEKWVQELIATEQNRRGFLQVAGVAAATFTLDGLRSAAHAASEATGKMKIENVGLMSPGDMGQAVAMQIKAKGLNVYTALEQRSARTRALAREAGLTDVGTVARLVAECDVVLSIMNPGAALDFAREAADALRASGRQTLIVDCNAIAPDTVHEIADVVERAGGRFLDAGIIGPPPRGKAKTNLYVSGPGAADLEQLGGPQLVVHVISEGIADASALKMCYGALNKGTQALWLEVLIAAQRLGIAGILEQQLQQSQADHYNWALSQFPILTPKAYRWVPEMLEISKTMGAAGVTPKVFQGAADIYRFVASTPLGKETPENRDKAREGKDVVRLLAQERSEVDPSGAGPEPR